jgi:hypothetical protein
METKELVRYDAMRRAIAQAHAVDEVKDIRDKALALETYARLAKNTDDERRVAEIRIRAERKCGELLITSPKGRPAKVSADPTLSKLGISRGQSSQWQKLAAVSEGAFETALAAPDMPTTQGIIRGNGEASRKAKWDELSEMDFTPFISTVHLSDYREKLAHVSANLIFTSPPYNIGSTALANPGLRRIDPKTGMRRVLKPGEAYSKKDFRGIPDYFDELPEREYQDQEAAFLIWCADHLSRGGVVVYNHKPRHKNKILIPPYEWFLRPEVSARLALHEEIVWDRGSTHNHCPQIMWQQTERLYVFTRAEDRDLYSPVNPSSDLWHIPPGTLHKGARAST